jgi:hypothetical protein
VVEALKDRVSKDARQGKHGLITGVFSYHKDKQPITFFIHHANDPFNGRNCI